MIRKVYLDMDGVLSNFELRFRELFDIEPASVRKNKQFSEHWTVFVQGNHFSSLDYYAGALELLEYLENKDVEVEILTSSGGDKYHDIVEQDKIRWLCERGIPHRANVVSSRSKKRLFAEADTLLIDDHADNIRQFLEAGGQGIHHIDIRETIAKLDELLK